MRFVRQTVSAGEMKSEQETLVGITEDTNHNRDGRKILIWI